MGLNESKLTDKQKRFCEEYLIDLNATQAAIRAGYSENTATEIGYENLTKPHIAIFIQEAQKELSAKTKLNAEWVINRFKEISDKCMQAEPVMVYDPDKKQMVESGEFRFDSSGANKATEMLGKHLGVFEKDNSQKKTELISPEILSNIIEKINKNAAS
jgi:phage terminase small subunit